MAERIPTIRQRRLWAELRRLRERAGWTGEEAAQRLGWSAAKLSRMENGKRGIKVADLQQVLAVYGVDDDRKEHLLQLARTAHERDWWDAQTENLPAEFGTYLSLEAEASSLRCFDAQLFSGLMQTADYARHVIRAALMNLYSPAEVERRVELRLARQAILERPERPALWCVLDEAILHRVIGGPETMRAQYERVIELAELPNVTLQVLPFEVGAHPVTSGTFAILRFPSRFFDDVVYVEEMASGLYVESEKEVHRYSLAFDHVRAIALSPDESLALIKRSAKA